MRVLIFWAFVCLSLIMTDVSAAGLKHGECEVCLSFMQKAIDAGLPKENKLEVIEDGLRKLCKKVTDKTEKRFCYYIGGSEDAATSMLRTISTPLKNKLPPAKICERLKAKDAEICGLKYERKGPVDYTKVEFENMRIKDLKDQLSEWNAKCEDCVEKGDFLRAIRNKLAEVSPDGLRAWDAREAAKKAKNAQDDDDLDL